MTGKAGTPGGLCYVTLPNWLGWSPASPVPSSAGRSQRVPSLPQNGDGHLPVEVFACEAWWHLGTMAKCYVLEPEA